MSEAPLTAWQAEADQAQERRLLAQARRSEPGPWLPASRAELLGSIREDLARRRGRAHLALPVAACCALAFFAGSWVASRPPRTASPAAAQAAGRERPSRPEAVPASRNASELAGAPGCAPAELMRWETLEFAGVGLIEVSGAGQYQVSELAAERQLRIDSGVLRAQIARQDPMRPLVIAAPDLRVVVVGTRFDLFVGTSLTRLDVIEGHVRVERGGRSIEVSGGESVHSDDPRLGPPPSMAPVPLAPAARPPRPRPAPLRIEAPPAPGTPAPEPLEDYCYRVDSPHLRRACLERVSREGDTLGAQQALFALGVLARDFERDADRAVNLWREYEDRFPSGALGPEVALELFETLLLRGRTEEALSTAARFEERFADDPRAPRVALARARILCGTAGERAQGRVILERLGASPSGGQLRDQIDELRAHCLGPSFGPAGPAGLVPRDVLGRAPPDD